MALEVPTDRRGRFLERRCAGDPDLRAEVESLLEHDDNQCSLLDTAGPLSSNPAPALPLPKQIGPYSIIGRIGEGGMGVVYEAEQLKPINRRVALKLIRSGHESDQVMARFDAESNVLARLDHPGIARVLDAGTTEQGLPYFAMDFVPGEPITKYCDRHRLDVRERLELFLRVCEGVEHAHRNAVIHRDIKPSNILVADTDDGLACKIIDFGVAKLLGDPPSDRALLTRTGQLIGTPAYMSPEQASGAPDLDTRTDVYALGAVLYELLVGWRPFGPSQADMPDSGEVRRRIREDDPTTPNERIRSLGREVTDVAEVRGTTPVALRRQVRGDLDWICLRALEKERSRRYGSVGELTEDVRRHLDDQPVLATPPSAAYRMRKFARRHRGGVTVAAILFPVLVGFSVVLALQANRVVRERDRAQQVSEFLVDFYATPPVLIDRYPSISLASIISRGVENSLTELEDHPDLQARLILALGESLLSSGNLVQAESTLGLALDRFRELRGAEDPVTLDAASSLARVHTFRRRYGEAEAMLVAGLEIRRRTLGADHVDTGRAHADLGYLYKVTKKFDRSARLFEEALQNLRRTLGHDHSETLMSAGLLASVYLELGRLEEAEALLMDSIPRMDERDPEIGMAHYNLACVAAQQGRRKVALHHLRRAAYDYDFWIHYPSDPHMAPLIDDPEFIELSKWVHIQVPKNRKYHAERAARLVDQKRYDEAEPIFLAFVRDLPWGGTTEHKLLGQFYLKAGRYQEAEQLFREQLELEAAVDGLRHPDRARLLWSLAQCRFGLGDREGTRVFLVEALDILEDGRELFSPDQEYLSALLGILEGDHDSALQHLRAAADQRFWMPGWTDHDLLLEPLRDTDEFGEVLAMLERRGGYP